MSACCVEQAMGDNWEEKLQCFFHFKLVNRIYTRYNDAAFRYEEKENNWSITGTEETVQKYKVSCSKDRGWGWSRVLLRVRMVDTAYALGINDQRSWSISYEHCKQLRNQNSRYGANNVVRASLLMFKSFPYQKQSLLTMVFSWLII